MSEIVKTRKYGFIGCGNMSQAIISGWIDSGTVPAEQIMATNRSSGKLKKVADQLGIQVINTNEELVDASDVVILGTKPQDLASAIEPIASAFTPGHIVVSLAAGLSLKSLQKLLPGVNQMVRVMPNTPIRIRQAVIGYCVPSSAQILQPFVEDLFAPLGLVVRVDEGQEFEALTVSCSSGIGFIYEMMVYWKEWLEEHDFDPTTATRMTVKTFLGASLLADQSEDISLDDLQSKVVSKKGVTAAGLQSMRELELERLLRYSFEKAVLRDRELGRNRE